MRSRSHWSEDYSSRSRRLLIRKSARNNNDARLTWKPAFNFQWSRYSLLCLLPWTALYRRFAGVAHDNMQVWRVLRSVPKAVDMVSENFGLMSLRAERQGGKAYEAGLLSPLTTSTLRPPRILFHPRLLFTGLPTDLGHIALQNVLS